MATGYVKTFRQIEEWEWYQDANTFRVFMHLILNAAYRETTFQGVTIPAGSFATTYEKIRLKLKITKSQARTAIEHLKSTGEITSTIAPKFIVFNIQNWAKYQGEETDERTQERSQERTQIAPKSKKYRTQIAPSIEEEVKKKEIQEEKKGALKDCTVAQGEKDAIDEMFETYAFLDSELLETMLAFKTMRAKKKEPLTERAAKIMLNTLDELATDNKTKIAIINQSILNGWKGVFQLKGNNYNKPQSETAEQDIARRVAAVEGAFRR